MTLAGKFKHYLSHVGSPFCDSCFNDAKMKQDTKAKADKMK